MSRLQFGALFLLGTSLSRLRFGNIETILNVKHLSRSDSPIPDLQERKIFRKQFYGLLKEGGPASARAI